MSAIKRGESYFRVMPWVLIGIVIFGFGWIRIQFPDQVQDLTGIYLIHAVLLCGWYLMLALQPRWIASARYDLHRKLGWSSLVLAVAMVISGYLITSAAIARQGFSIAGNDPVSSTIFPFSDIVTFIIAYTLAIIFRRTGDAHKRLMLLSGMLMMDPAVARAILSVGLPEPLILLVELSLFMSLLIYDRRSLGKFHWASIVGLLLWVIQMIAKMGFAKHEGWINFAKTFFAV